MCIIQVIFQIILDHQFLLCHQKLKNISGRLDIQQTISILSDRNMLCGTSRSATKIKRNNKDIERIYVGKFEGVRCIVLKFVGSIKIKFQNNWKLKVLLLHYYLYIYLYQKTFCKGPYYLKHWLKQH